MEKFKKLHPEKDPTKRVLDCLNKTLENEFCDSAVSSATIIVSHGAIVESIATEFERTCRNELGHYCCIYTIEYPPSGIPKLITRNSISHLK